MPRHVILAITRGALSASTHSLWTDLQMFLDKPIGHQSESCSNNPSTLAMPLFTVGAWRGFMQELSRSIHILVTAVPDLANMPQHAVTKAASGTR